MAHTEISFITSDFRTPKRNILAWMYFYSEIENNKNSEKFFP